MVDDALADGRLVAPFEMRIPARDAHFVVTPEEAIGRAGATAVVPGADAVAQRAGLGLDQCVVLGWSEGCRIGPRPGPQATEGRDEHA